MNLRTDFPLTRYLVDQGVLEQSPFTLIDVGCRGGINTRWRTFGNDLKAYAIDPLIHEIDKLQEAEKNPNVNYWASYIGLPTEHPLVMSRASQGPWGNNPWQRLSTAWAAEIIASETDDESTKVARNDWISATLTESSNRVGLTEFVKQHEIDALDFIKVDVDGEDLYALLSGEELMACRETLGFELEVNFFGTASETDNTFHNTDKLMRKHGYELFDLTVRRYSKRSLPTPFVLNMPAQTEWGAPLQGDAFYARDVVGEIGRSASRSWPTVKLFKLIALHQLFRLPDCAAEILLAFEKQLSQLVDVKHLLDLLTPELDSKT